MTEAGIMANPGLAGEISRQFSAQGYAGPLRVLSARECRQFLKAVRKERGQPPLDWFKGHAASSRAFYELGAHPAIIEVVTKLLGEDLMLWGASIVIRDPGALHPWHSDIETADAPGKTVSVWLGLENTNHDCALLLISHSHRFGASVQEVRQHLRKSRSEISTDDLVRWAGERDERSCLAKHAVADGEALFFDGAIWHGSHNVSRKTRRAVLLQYATPDAVIRMPNPKNLEWPFQWVNSPRPPCVMVMGSDRFGVNRMVTSPVTDRDSLEPRLPCQVYPLRLPLPPGEKKGWKAYPIFNGSTAGIHSLSCHVSALSQNYCPHPPHRHEEEEILALLAGEVELNLPDLPTSNGNQSRRLQSGAFVYYPAHFAHTLRTVSEQPANYLMFKWKNGGGAALAASSLPFGHFQLLDRAENSGESGDFRQRLVFEGTTGCLRKLHCHSSTLAPGAGYDPHVDAYDVAIIVLEGELETLGQRVKPHSVIFYPAGEPHGMSNPTGQTVRYVVFEFHAPHRTRGKSSFNLPAWIPSKFAERQYWKRKFRRMVSRFTRSSH